MQTLILNLRIGIRLNLSLLVVTQYLINKLNQLRIEELFKKPRKIYTKSLSQEDETDDPVNQAGPSRDHNGNR